MKIFHCDSCGSLVFFENVQCVKCGRTLAFLPDILDVSALQPDPANNNSWQALTPAAGKRVYHQCQNWREHRVCNWLVPAGDGNPFCLACRMNQTIPDLTVAGNSKRWFKMEKAKRRLVYTLLRLQLPIQGNPQANAFALQFNFLAQADGGATVFTGHQDGLITMNIAEADDEERDKRRVNFYEPYRTLLGHFRHEAAHYYWDRLIAGTPQLTRFRELFGDETQDYATALRNYYHQGAPADWQMRHVSAYCCAHPWEDWAESFAHYLHIMDTIETAAGFGMTLRPDHPEAKVMTADPKTVAEVGASFDLILNNWLPLTYALNSLNRGMGLSDLYPFVLSTPAIEKLRYIHETVQESSAIPSRSAPTPDGSV